MAAFLRERSNSNASRAGFPGGQLGSFNRRAQLRNAGQDERGVARAHEGLVSSSADFGKRRASPRAALRNLCLPAAVSGRIASFGHCARLRSCAIACLTR